MIVIRRYDAGDLRPAHKTAEGYLFFEGYATRAGVFPYLRTDGSIEWELRHPSEVGSADSIGSMARKPVTDTHPSVFVDSSNASKFAAGVVDSEIIWEQDLADGFVKVRGVIQRKDAVDSVLKGRMQLSAGYTAELHKTPGVWMDAFGAEHKYDSVQKNIRYNHLALVDRGRAGPNARLRVDGDDLAVMLGPDYDISKLADAGDGARRYWNLGSGTSPAPTDPAPKGAKKEKTMEKIVISGAEYKTDEAAAIQRAVADVEKARTDAVSAATEAKAEVATLRKQLEDKAAETQGLQAKIDVLEAAPKDQKTDAEIEAERVAWFNDRTELLGFAASAKVEIKDGDSNSEIKKAIVLTQYDADLIVTNDHVDFAWSLIKKAKTKTTHVQELASRLPNAHRKSTRVDDDMSKAIREARDGYTKRITDSYNEAN